jgi:hypothetical protein
MCLPISAVAAREVDAKASRAPAAARPGSSMDDVALAPGGLLVGQILDETLQPVRGAAVEIEADGLSAASTVTDANGVFAVSGMRGGVHQVVVQNSIENCRLWAPGTAPPSAQAVLRCIPGQENVIRGQWSPHPWLTNPWLIGGVIVTAIAVPIVLNNLDDDEDNGS